MILKPKSLRWTVKTSEFRKISIDVEIQKYMEVVSSIEKKSLIEKIATKKKYFGIYLFHTQKQTKKRKQINLCITVVISIPLSCFFFFFFLSFKSLRDIDFKGHRVIN